MKKKITIIFTCLIFVITTIVFSLKTNLKNTKKVDIKNIATIYTNSKEFFPSMIKNNIIIKPEEIKELEEQKKVINKKEDVDIKKEEIKKEEVVVKKQETIKEEVKKEVEKNIVYSDMTLDELAAKLNKSLNSTIAGKGELIASYSLELGVDPYLATAIILQETGCKWTCSKLVRECNNVGGQKGGPSCNGGAYKSYETLDEGIRGYLDNLYNKYIALGLTTPETINPKYAQDTNWKNKVNEYMIAIKEA